jgi:hypothetical protein
VLALVQPEKATRDGDFVPADADEAAHADDRRGHRTVRATMMSSIFPTSSSASLATLVPRICFFALQPMATSCTSTTSALNVVEPATLGVADVRSAETGKHQGRQGETTVRDVHCGIPSGVRWEHRPWHRPPP